MEWVFPKLLVNTGARLRRETSASLPFFLHQKSAEAYIMDPRDTPGYRLHRALSNLNSIDTEQLDSPDQERIEKATMVLEQVGLLTQPGASAEANVTLDS